ncbi:helix-turn-helix domain-containing protein [Streptomyces niger]|uniref:helix-turn-helix domain-containing protein n=1 Tax=Streptomyces niger TaxID=66373 RepID=UPI00069C6DFF|nr:XRE family transcriptional regulator [Streptomyces niger]
MPRWRALPDELDPQVREFAEQLRTLVERSGLSISAVADRTGYSKTSWERYLNGRLLAPRRAVLALAEVTGAHTGHLTTMWELAERAWSRAEMRHDVTMEAIRVAEARAALGEFGPAPATAKKSGKRSAAKGAAAPSAAPAPAGPYETPVAPYETPAAATKMPHQRAPGTSSGAFPATPAAESQAAPATPSATPSAPPAASSAAPSAPSAADFADPGPRPAPAGPPSSAAYAPPSYAPDPAHGADSPYGPDPRSVSAPHDSERRRRITMFVTGVVGALLLIAAAVLLLGGGEGGQQAKPAPATPTASQEPALPAGVKCFGTGCAGKDPEETGCGGDQATSPSRGVMGGALIEVRYSKVCGTAWARMTGGAQGDRATVTSGGRTEQATAGRDGSAYTAMVPVSGPPEKVRACGTTDAGYQSCTTPRAARSGGPSTAATP